MLPIRRGPHRFDISVAAGLIGGLTYGTEQIAHALRSFIVNTSSACMSRSAASADASETLETVREFGREGTDHTFWQLPTTRPTSRPKRCATAKRNRERDRGSRRGS
jgi:hypothetical protein